MFNFNIFSLKDLFYYDIILIVRAIVIVNYSKTLISKLNAKHL